jgi:hypothetical protein
MNEFACQKYDKFRTRYPFTDNGLLRFPRTRDVGKRQAETLPPRVIQRRPRSARASRAIAELQGSAAKDTEPVEGDATEAGKLQVSGNAPRLLDGLN